MRREVENWMAGGKLARGGRPLVWYHGTDCEDSFNIFTRWDDHSVGFHFGTSAAANDRLNAIFRMEAPEERGGRIIPVICRAVNPLRMHDQYTWETRSVAIALADACGLDDEFVDWVCDQNSAEAIYAAFECLGYDAVVYTNECEDKSGIEDSLMIWRSELIKSPFSAVMDRADPSILSQAETDVDHLREWETIGANIDFMKEELNAMVLNTEFAHACLSPHLDEREDGVSFAM
jgi:hypothetical protein